MYRFWIFSVSSHFQKGFIIKSVLSKNPLAFLPAPKDTQFHLCVTGAFITPCKAQHSPSLHFYWDRFAFNSNIVLPVIYHALFSGFWSPAWVASGLHACIVKCFMSYVHLPGDTLCFSVRPALGTQLCSGYLDARKCGVPPNELSSLFLP